MWNQVIVEKISRANGNGHQKDDKFESDQVKSLLMSKEEGIINQNSYPENNMRQHPDFHIFQYFR